MKAIAQDRYGSADVLRLRDGHVDVKGQRVRFAFPACAFSAAPYCTPIARVGSDRSGYWNLNFSAKALFSWTLSKLTPRMTAFFACKSRARSRSPQPCSVQPGVSAFG